MMISSLSAAPTSLLQQALEKAQIAVQLDQSDSNPQEAISAYKFACKLMDEVMELTQLRSRTANGDMGAVEEERRLEAIVSHT